MDSVKTKVLNNGLRVLLVPVEGVPSVSVMMLVGMGSRYENRDTCGRAHFYEHLVHDGSEKFPTSKLFAEVLESKGADSNAMTGEEFTAYYTKLEARHLTLAIEMMSEMMLRPLVLEVEVEREKGVIVEEINMREDMPHIKVCDRVSELLFEGHELGLPTAGTKETVRSFNRNDFLELKKNAYTCENCILVISGQLVASDEEVFDQVQKNFEFMSKSDGVKKVLLPPVPMQTAKFEVVDKLTDQVHLALAFRGYARSDDHRYAQNLVAILLGGGFSSRLFQKVRQELGLAYSIHTDVDLFTDSGLWLVTAGLEKSRLSEASKVIWEELVKIRELHAIDMSELQKCKDYLRGQTALRLEDPLQLGMYYGMQWLLDGEIRPLSAVFEKVDKVSVEELQMFAKQVFVPENLACVVVGDVEKGILESIFV